MNYWAYLTEAERKQLEDISTNYREAIKARRRLYDRCRKRARKAKEQQQ